MSKKTYSNIMLGIILAAGVILSFYGAAYIYNFDMGQIEDDFHILVRDRVERFQRKINNDIDILYSVAGLFAAREKVERDEFKNFVKYILYNKPDILSVDWAPIILDTEKQMFEETVRKEGFPEYQVVEIDSEGNILKSAKHKEYFPIYYTEPFEKNKIIFGLDLGSSSGRQEALETAIKKGKPIASGWIKLAREHSEEFACRIFIPVYRKDDKRGVKGLVSLLFEIVATAESSWGKLESKGLSVCVFNKGDLKDRKYLCLYGLKGEPHDLDEKSIIKRAVFIQEEEIKIANTKWGMVFAVSPEFYSSRKGVFWRPLIVFILGLVISVLLVIHLRELLSRTAKIEKEVIEKTNELTISNRLLQEANEKLKKLDKIKSDFVANVAHELKNPLFIIKLSVENILDGISCKINEDQKESFGMVKKNIDRLIRLVTDVLDISKIEAGEMKLKMEQIDMVSLVGEIVDDYKIEISQKRLMVTKDFQKNIGPVWADRDKLSEVIINLLNNAIKYTPEGGDISIRLLGEENGIRFEISDTGSGIAKENLEKIFNKFERVTAEKQEGTGLGLPIARDIVLLHKGNIWVESELGKGSKFTFTMPYKSAS